MLVNRYCVKYCFIIAIKRLDDVIWLVQDDDRTSRYVCLATGSECCVLLRPEFNEPLSVFRSIAQLTEHTESLAAYPEGRDTWNSVDEDKNGCGEAGQLMVHRDV